ncbi:LysR family transcriptional regulator [Diaphorobacter aerolatus]|uniref:LysR family transcriptional regulator n=1 Tax=Diaphorobacter aerolatus TaxID=1288495 RepID=A0A7H0GQU0_9BURK|nr:LysR family transcriptional regulator [Diaphorobacter aerolatus]
MDLAGVAVFLQTAAAGNLSAAARRLGIPPLAAARRLASLENGLGVRLMHRTTRSVSLTTEGEAFLPFATTIQEAAEAPRWPVQIPPPVATPNSPGKTGWIMTTQCRWRCVRRPL